LKSITFDGGNSSGKLPTKATMSTSLAGNDNDIDYTAHSNGLAGNNITVRYAVTTQAGSATTVTVSGNAITVNLATGGSAQAASGTLTSDATNPSDGDTFVLGAITYTFKTNLTGAANEIKIGADAATTLDNVKSAVNATAGAGSTYGTGTVANAQASATTNTNTTQLFVAVTAGAAGNSIVLTENSSHLTVSGSGTGGGTLEGGADAGQITVNASAVITAIQASTPASALVDVALSAGNDGTGLVTEMAATSLAGGSDGIIPLFTVTGECLVSLRAYCSTTLAGANATLVHGKTGTTNDLITILTATNITKGSGIDSTNAVIARGTALAKTPLKLYNDGETIFATVATASVTGGTLHYIADYIALTEDACVTPA
jgi:hypothetical protein